MHTKIYANRLTPVSCWPEQIVGSVEDVQGWSIVAGTGKWGALEVLESTPACGLSFFVKCYSGEWSCQAPQTSHLTPFSVFSRGVRPRPSCWLLWLVNFCRSQLCELNATAFPWVWICNKLSLLISKYPFFNHQKKTWETAANHHFPESHTDLRSKNGQGRARIAYICSATGNPAKSRTPFPVGTSKIQRAPVWISSLGWFCFRVSGNLWGTQAGPFGSCGLNKVASHACNYEAVSLL